MPASLTGHRLITWVSTSGQHQRAPQAIDTVAILDFADARIAGRQHDQLGAPQVQAGGFFGGQYAVIIAAAMEVGSGKRQP